jgi:hypothetical protein
VTHTVEFYILIITALGFAASVFILVLLKRVREKIDKNISDLEKL